MVKKKKACLLFAVLFLSLVSARAEDGWHQVVDLKCQMPDVVYLIDTSGSAADYLDESIRMVHEALRASDGNHVAVAAFAGSDNLRVICPLERATACLPYLAEANLEAEGDTYLSPALEWAGDQLAGSVSSHRAVVILSDGQVREADQEASLRAAYELLGDKVILSDLRMGDYSPVYWPLVEAATLHPGYYGTPLPFNGQVLVESLLLCVRGILAVRGPNPDQPSQLVAGYPVRLQTTLQSYTSWDLRGAVGIYFPGGFDSFPIDLGPWGNWTSEINLLAPEGGFQATLQYAIMHADWVGEAKLSLPVNPLPGVSFDLPRYQGKEGENLLVGVSLGSSPIVTATVGWVADVPPEIMEPAWGEMIFLPGQQSQAIDLLLVDDGKPVPGGERSVKLRLTGATGATVSLGEAEVVVIDNDGWFILSLPMVFAN